MKRRISYIVGMILAASLTVPPMADAAQKTRTTLRVGQRYQGTTLRLSRSPTMVLIPETSVYYIGDDADYDLYRYGNRWYYVEDGNWYRARTWEGPFTYTMTASVPRPIRGVPREYRRTWISEAGEPSAGTGSYRTLRVGDRYRGNALALRSQPSMALVPESRIYYIRGDSDYDLYRYESRWYYVEDGKWYEAPSWRGPFVYVRTRDVPRSVLTVPAAYRKTWVYPSASRGVESRMVVPVGHTYRGASLGFSSAPPMAIIPDTDVYYLREEADFDLYRRGSTWYLVQNGVWYRSSSWRGPFVRIRMSAVPSAVVGIPAGYRKTWAPLTGS